MSFAMSIKRKAATNPDSNPSKKQNTTSKHLYLFDLNNDCLLNIFDRLDHHDLVNIALVNGTIDPEHRGRFAELAGKIFANKKADDKKLFIVTCFAGSKIVNRLIFYKLLDI